MRKMEIIKNTYGRLYSKSWVEFDLVSSRSAEFRFRENKFEVQPGSAVFICANCQFAVSAPVTRYQIPLSYFDSDDNFDSTILKALGSCLPVTIIPVGQPGRAIIMGLHTIRDLQEKESSSLTYLEPGILYSTLETFQLFLRSQAGKAAPVTHRNLKLS